MFRVWVEMLNSCKILLTVTSTQCGNKGLGPVAQARCCPVGLAFSHLLRLLLDVGFRETLFTPL